MYFKKKITEAKVGPLKRLIKFTNLQQDLLRFKETQIANFKNERGKITTEATDIKRLVTEYVKKQQQQKKTLCQKS